MKGAMANMKIICARYNGGILYCPRCQARAKATLLSSHSLPDKIQHQQSGHDAERVNRNHLMQKAIVANELT